MPEERFESAGRLEDRFSGLMMPNIQKAKSKIVIFFLQTKTPAEET